MSRTARLWKGAGSLTLGGLLLSGAVALAADPSADQFVNLGNQAKTMGRSSEAAKFFEQALKRDPKNADARRGLESLKLVRRNLQDPPPPPPPGGVPPAPRPATRPLRPRRPAVLTRPRPRPPATIPRRPSSGRSRPRRSSRSSSRPT